MIKLRIFLNDPRGKTWDSYCNMFPGLGDKYNLEIEKISKTRDAYRSAEYQATGLPMAPALMLDDELLIQGGPISEEAFETAVHRHLTNKWQREILKADGKKFSSIL